MVLVRHSRNVNFQSEEYPVVEAGSRQWFADWKATKVRRALRSQKGGGVLDVVAMKERVLLDQTRVVKGLRTFPSTGCIVLP